MANRSYNNNHYTFSDFLSLSDISELYDIESEIRFAGVKLYGGYEDAERCVARFGDMEVLGYDEEFPISIIHIEPHAKKFAENLGHRDVLGALINLGIKREVLGDIIIADKEYYVFCLRDISEFIIENLSKIRHTNVKCQIEENFTYKYEPERISEEHIVASVRGDAIISKVFKLSRNTALNMFREKKVFVNGKTYENNSGMLKSGDIVSVRGYGKFKFEGILRETKKGKSTIKVVKYGK